MAILRLATRGSRLALWQAEWVRAALKQAHPEIDVELLTVVSTGDIVRDKPLHQMGGIGVFTKEIQDAVLGGQADIAVHSLKDLPTQSHPELALAATPARGSAADVLLAPRHRTLSQLPHGATVATSSLRRRAQLLHVRPDLHIVDVRGNVETRVHKLTAGDFDGLILAAAGLERLGLLEHITETLDFTIMLPAVGQGALGVECRRESAMVALVRRIEDVATRQAIDAERALLAGLQGGCQLPIAAHATVAGGSLSLQARVVSVDGKRLLEDACSGSADDAAIVGVKLAERMLARGARALLQ